MAQTVSYEAAMANLRSMFSGVDDEVIAMLLQSNNGHLERTVEQLLGITGGAADVGAGGGGVPSHSLSVPHSGGGSARRRSSNSERAPPGQQRNRACTANGSGCHSAADVSIRLIAVWWCSREWV